MASHVQAAPFYAQNVNMPVQQRGGQYMGPQQQSTSAPPSQPLFIPRGSSSISAEHGLTQQMHGLSIQAPPTAITHLAPEPIPASSSSSSSSSSALAVVEPKGPPVSSKKLRFPTRPGRGQTGTKCIVKANHFFAELPNKDLHQYDVNAVLPPHLVASNLKPISHCSFNYINCVSFQCPQRLLLVLARMGFYFLIMLDFLIVTPCSSSSIWISLMLWF
jgi:hypothetical protein